MIHILQLTEEQYQDYLKYLTYAPNVQDVKKPTKREYGGTKHPTIKPVKLMEWFVGLLSNEGDIVLDIFAGSGSTLVACSNLNRKAIGIELNEEYIPSIQERAPNATILEGDCVEQLRTLPDASITSIITDPPYSVSIAKWDTFKTLKHYQEWCEEWGQECYRVLKPGGTIASFCAARTYHYLAMALDNNGFVCRDMIEWVYWNLIPKGKNLKGCHEPIYLGLKGEVNQMIFNIDSVRIPATHQKGHLTLNDRVKIPHSTINTDLMTI